MKSTENQQEEIQEAHRDRADAADVGDPLYGLASVAGHQGEAPVEESAADEAAEEPGRHVEEGTNLTWGIVLGGALLLFLVAGILIWGVGVSYSAAIITQYPVK